MLGLIFELLTSVFIIKSWLYLYIYECVKGFWNNFLNRTRIAQETAKTDKSDYIKLKSLCIKGYNQQSEKENWEQEKMFASHKSDKWLKSTILKELLQHNNHIILF